MIALNEDRQLLKDWVTYKFNLTSSNGINKVRIIADDSEHYECYLDTLQ